MAFAMQGGAVSGPLGGGGGGRGNGNGNGEHRQEGESITLADVKVGDNVAGQGSLKNGIFVPTELRVADPSQRRHRQNQNDAAPPAQGPQ